MKRQMRRLAGLLIALSLCVGTVVSAGAVTIDEAEKKADELKQQKDKTEKEKNSLQSELDTILTNMEETKEKLVAKEEEIAAAEDELVQAKIDESEQYESMKKRIRFMYESGGVSLLEILLTSENMGDFLNRAEYVSRMSEYDRNELVRYQDTVKQVEEKEARLQEEQAALEQIQTELIEQQGKVQALLNSKDEKLKELKTQIKENEDLIADLKAKAEEARRIQEEQARAEEARRQQALQAQQSGGSGGSNGYYTPPVSGNVVSGNGYFTHPCPGMSYKSSYFGEIRPYELGGHRGNDYAAPTGTPTYAAAAGTVVIAGYSSSAGNWVVINHGNGLVTKYMHHSSLCVYAGQTVAKGQQIGAVGSTGQSTGPHLHFQVELNGVPVNPDLYL